MGELRWILLGIGLLVLAGIYAFTRFGLRLPRRRPSDAADRVEPRLDRDEVASEADVESELVLSQEPPPPVPEGPTMVVTFRLMSRDKAGFPGDELVLAMRSAGLRHGRFGIFHAHESEASDTTLFSVASLVEPGSFELSSLKDTRLPGVSLFQILPGPADDLESFEQMLETARALADKLDGELLDEHGSSMSVQRERYIRDEIQQFQRELKVSIESMGSTW